MVTAWATRLLITKKTSNYAYALNAQPTKHQALMATYFVHAEKLLKRLSNQVVTAQNAQFT